MFFRVGWRSSRTIISGIVSVALGATLAMVAGVGSASAATTTVLYASPSGSGTTCTQAVPCSLSGAQTAVRTALGAAPGSDVSVMLAGGTYSLASTLNLGAADSGSAGHPVVWKAAAGAHPVISGASPVTGWSEVDTTNGIWAATVPTSSASRQLYIDGQEAPIAQANLSQLGFTGGWTGSSTGYTISSDAAAVRWFGALNATQVSNVEFNYIGGNGPWTDPSCRVASATSTTLTMDTPCWPDTTARASYADASGGLPSMSTSTLPTTVENAYSLLHPGQWFLDSSANKLYYMPAAWQQMANLDVELPHLESLVQVAGTLASPVHDLTFQGLQFSYATWNAPSGPAGFADVQSNLHFTGATNQGMCTFSTPNGSCPWGSLTQPLANVTLSAANNITITGNLFTNLGGAGLNIVYGSTNDTVQGNEFTGIGSTAILLGCTYDPTPSPTYATVIKQNCTPNPSAVTGDSVGTNEIVTGTTVANNLVHNIGTDYPSASGITLLFTQHTTVTHNDVYDVPYTGITAGIVQGHVDNVTHPQDSTNINSNNVISNNLIHNYMERLNDGGAIYIEGHQAQYIYAADGTTIDPTKTLANALQVSGNVAYAGNDNFTYYNDAGSEWVVYTGNVQFDSPASGTGGCQPTGHFWVTSNYLSGSVANNNVCYGSGTTATDTHATGNVTIPVASGPNDLPQSVLASAGLTSAYEAALEPPSGARLYYVSPGETTGSTSSVIIAGAGFSSSTPVFFGTQAATSVTAISHGFLLAAVPSGASASSARVVPAPTTAGPGRVDDTATSITYTGSWSAAGGRGYGDYNDNVHYTTTNGDSESLTFTGTSVSVYGELNSDQGNVGISVDGATATTVSTTSTPRQANQILWSSPALNSGVHTVTVTKLSGTYTTTDGFGVAGTTTTPPPTTPPPVRVDDTATSITYTGSWSAAGGRGYGDYNDNVHYTTTNGDSESLTFTGTSVSVYGELNSDQGNVGISVDGATATTVSTTSTPRQANQILWSSPALNSGVHTVTVTKLSGTYTTTDGFSVTS